MAEILAAAQSESCGIVTISPLVSPLKVSSSSPTPYGEDGEEGEQLEEVYESDVKFAGVTPMHVAASR